jgi:DNA-binding NarL/FixJ family response regulator
MLASGTAGAGADGGKIRVLLADDYPLLREGLRVIIERDRNLLICGLASSPGEALAAIASQKPHVVLLAFSLTSAATFALIREARARHEKIPLLVLSFTDDPVLATRVSRAGAHGYLAPADAPGCLVEAIYRLARGLTYVGAKTSLAVAGDLFDETGRRPEPGLREFTNREQEILELVGSGLTSREIAEALRLSIKTVESHRQNIKQKLGLKTATRLAQYAFQWLHRRQPEERRV